MAYQGGSKPQDWVLSPALHPSGHSHRFLDDHNDVEFIGFVNLYTKANSERSIQAFHIVAMALFRFDIPESKTIIGSLISAREMHKSTIQERLIQIIQLLQFRRHKYRKVSFELCGNDLESRAALDSAGFDVPHIPDGGTSPDRLLCHGKSSKTIIMVCHVFRTSWLKYFHMISILDPFNNQHLGNERIVEIIVNDTLRELSILRHNHVVEGALVHVTHFVHYLRS